MKTWRITGSQDLAVSPRDGVVGRHGAPAEDRLALGLDDLLEALLQAAALDPVARQEDQPAAVLARLGQGDAGLLAGFLQEGVRHLDQDAGAVAGVGLRAGRAAVVEVLQDLDRLPQDLVRLAALHVDHEADAARVVLEPRVVESLLRRARRAPCDRPCGRIQVLWALLGVGMFKLGAFFEPNCVSGSGGRRRVRKKKPVLLLESRP